ncbi:MAG: helix-turn-helix transcriptional regulator [Phenylobacterium sp.]|jgi:DNA-binding NarL/FixJ family response regulator
MSNPEPAQAHPNRRWDPIVMLTHWGIAAGARAAVTAERLRDWAPPPPEADVAVFALKGFDVAEIAGLRSAAEGTVRAQLAQVYRKAGVNSRAALACLFLEDLIPGPVAGDRPVSP